ncbi:MAG: ketopantoate reductase family protein [Candidatus Aminicenantes bacterium]|nr:ketopantoate reductase family protein [Candidatus Aminicenantes bacterium]
MPHKVVIIGLGAISSVLSGILLENPDCRLKVIVKKKHLKTLKNKGLLLTNQTDKRYFPEVHDSIDFDLKDTLVIPLVKLYDLRQVTEQIQHQVRPSTRFLILQNGIHIRSKIEEWSAGRITSQQMFRGYCQFGATLMSIGKVRYFLGTLVIEKKFFSSPFSTIFASSFIDVHVSSNIKQRIWKKLLINSIYNPLSMILKTSNNVISGEKINPLKQAILNEGLAVAASEGFRINLDIEGLNSLVQSDNLTSMYQDYSFNRPTEIDYLNGEIIRTARKNNIPVPVNTFIVDLIHSLLFIRDNQLSRSK